MNKFFKIALAVGAVVAAGSAGAATATATFPVTATVDSNCIATATAMVFPNYAPGSGAPASTSTISVRCSVGVGYSVGLNAGTFTGATVTTRRMANGVLPLAYSLTQDAAHAVNWGNTAPTDTQAGTGAGMGVLNATAFTVYGIVPDSGANLLATAGAYSDTITVNVVY